MSRRVLIEEYHLSIFVPRGLGPAASRAARRTLAGAPFRAALLEAARHPLRRYRSLDAARVTLSR